MMIVIIIFLLFFAFSAKAVCPICTIVVGAGLSVSRLIGIDDTISGLWVGGLLVSLILWTINFLKKKNINFPLRDVAVFLGYYAIVVIPLCLSHMIGNPFNVIFGIDKLVAGIVLGSIFFYLGAALYNYLKEKNGGKAMFPYQKVVMPILPLIILSIVFYFLLMR